MTAPEVSAVLRMPVGSLRRRAWNWAAGLVLERYRLAQRTAA